MPRVITRAEIEIAEGKALDELGALICEPRFFAGYSDYHYRRYVLGCFDHAREKEQVQRKAHEAGTGDCCARARARRTSQAFGTVETSVSVTSRAGTEHFAQVRIESGRITGASSNVQEIDRASGLPVDSAARKATPVFSGVMKYFPDALCEVAALSMAGNEKHNPGEALHWAKEKSTDEDDCVIRHMLNAAKGQVFDEESYPGKKIRHRAAVAWRALAGLQRELDAEAEIARIKRLGASVGYARHNAVAIDPGSKEPGTVHVHITSAPGMSNGCPKPPPDTWKPVVIIESPYAGHTKRNMIFLKYCERACLRAGEIPIASHRLFTEALDDAKPADRELGISAGFELHRLADRQVVFNDLGVTPGMKKGITAWNEIHKHCRPTDFRRLPTDLRLAFEDECAENGARL